MSSSPGEVTGCGEFLLHAEDSPCPAQTRSRKQVETLVQAILYILFVVLMVQYVGFCFLFFFCFWQTMHVFFTFYLKKFF